MSVPFVVASTDLIVTVPRAVAEFFSGLSNLQVFEPPINAPEFSVRQYWDRRFQKDGRIVWLRSTMAELYQGFSMPTQGF
jgi:hypothetical protein